MSTQCNAQQFKEAANQEYREKLNSGFWNKAIWDNTVIVETPKDSKYPETTYNLNRLGYLLRSNQ